LISLQESRLKGLEEEFKRDLDILKTEFDKEKMEIEQSHEMEKKELSDMIETFDEVTAEKKKKLRDDYKKRRQEIQNENVEVLETMKHDLIKKIEDLDKDFEVNFNRYVADTSNSSEEYT